MPHKSVRQESAPPSGSPDPSPASANPVTHDGANGRTVTRYTPFEELPELLTPLETRTWLDVRRSKGYEIARQRGIRFGRTIRVPKGALLPRRRS